MSDSSFSGAGAGGMMERIAPLLRHPLIAVLLAVAVWQALVWLAALPPFILPGPVRVAEALWLKRVTIAENAIVTIGEVLAGLAIGAALGALTAIQLASSPAARALIRPVLVFMQAVPVFALAPVLVLWLGYGLWSKIAMAVLIIYFPVTSSFYDGLTRTPQRSEEHTSELQSRGPLVCRL